MISVFLHVAFIWTGLQRNSSKSGETKVTVEFCVLLTVHLVTVFVNNQLDAQFFFLYLFIQIPYMFRATNCSSSRESVVSIRPLVYITLSMATVWYAGLDGTNHKDKNSL